MSNGTRTPCTGAEAELREKGPRFLGIVVPVADEAAARSEIEAIRRRYADATHHCWASSLHFSPVVYCEAVCA